MVDNLLRGEVDRDAQVFDTSEPLWDWFGLSYASFCVLPRVLMHAMPAEWQTRMAELLEEYDAAWDWSNLEDIKTRVQAIDPRTGRIVWLSTWLKDYRYPDKHEINNLKRKEYSR